MNNRRLTLKREVLQELSANDLGNVGGAGGLPTTIGVAETMYSCLHYISCAFLNTCMVRETVLCVVATTD